MSNPGGDELRASLAKLQEYWQVTNKYSADAACKHCEGIVRHEPWCITQNTNVEYAFNAAGDSDGLSTRDQISIRGMGVAWGK